MTRSSGLLLGLAITCCLLVSAWARLPLGLTPLNGTMRRLQQVSGTDYQVFFVGTPTTCTSDGFAMSGKTFKVPSNLPVIFPANALVWSDADVQQNCAILSLSITANYVPGSGDIIVGMIDATHLNAVAGVGYIQAFPDGSSVTVTSDPAVSTNPIQLVLNDPLGAYSDGTVTGLLAAFQVDPINAVVTAATGFPMCIPNAINCPTGTKGNRLPSTGQPATAPRDTSLDSLYPAFITQGVTTNGWRGQNGYQYIVSPFTNSNFNASQKAALQVQDFITFEGYCADATCSKVICWTIQASQLALYTEPGYEPAYAVYEDATIGTASAKTAGAAAALAEAAIRTRFEGFTTDPFRPIKIGAVDYDSAPVAGVPVGYREYGLIMPDYGPDLKGVQAGRWRFRPPCTNALPDTGNKGCTAPTIAVCGGGGGGGGGGKNGGGCGGGVTVNLYYPAPREVIAAPGQAPNPQGPQNGAIRTWYQNPTIEYLFGEGLPGQPPVPNTFSDLPYLQGGYIPGFTGPLSPWPETTNNGGKAPRTPLFNDLRANATWCSNQLRVCAWFTPPPNVLDYQVYLLPYFTGGTGGNPPSPPTQVPPKFDFTLTTSPSSTQMIMAQVSITNGVAKNCLTLPPNLPASRPSLPLQVVIRSTGGTPDFVGDATTIPIKAIAICPATAGDPTDPGGRYGFAPPYITL